MSLSYDLYHPGSSWLYRLDARVKLFAVVCSSFVLLSYHNLWLMLLALIVVQLVLLNAGIGWRMLWNTWRILWPVMVMIILFTTLFTAPEGAILFRWWILTPSVGSLARGVAIALRIASLALIILSWLYTTDQATITRSLVALGLPYPWGLTLAIALRFIPTMAATFRVITDAQQARALELAKGSLLRRARAYIPIAVAMIIMSLRTAEALSRALVSRGFGMPRQRSVWRRLHLRPQDLAWLAAIIVLTAGALWARYALGLGAHTLQLLR